jgi:hypothetical protein
MKVQVKVVERKELHTLKRRVDQALGKSSGIYWDVIKRYISCKLTKKELVHYLEYILTTEEQSKKDVVYFIRKYPQPIIVYNSFKFDSYATRNKPRNIRIPNHRIQHTTRL